MLTLLRSSASARSAPRRGRAARGLAEHDRSALYLGLLPLVNSAGVELPDDAGLLRELRGLERRRGASGRDWVDHAPGAHDDRANAVAGVAYLLAESAQPFVFSLGADDFLGIGRDVARHEELARRAEILKTARCTGAMRERIRRSHGSWIPGSPFNE